MQITTIASGSSGNAYTVTDGKTTLLLEAGLPAHKLCVATDLSAIDGCLISHEHMDHSKGAAELTSRYGVPIIASRKTLAALRLENSFFAEPVEDREEIRCKGLIIKAFSVPHDAADPMGFLIKSSSGDKLMFITDAFYIPIRPPVGLTHLMVECNHSVELLDETIMLGDTPHEQRERIRRSHMSLETLIGWLDKNADRLDALQEIHLIHISSRNGDPRLFKEKIQEATGKLVHIC
ncbi:MAG: MBL fold metallo-hydrolase [Ruminococcaceae bacterium]|nr:MBL fold metallo-hydrolase [Oscillospiraceae bacterium]